MTLKFALALADKIGAGLTPFCARLAIAGSIRRARPNANDIDLVVIPAPGQTAALRERVTRHATLVTDGPEILIVRLPNGVQLDVYFAHAGLHDLLTATPSNWGSVLLCRTGSKEHNIYLCQRARQLGLRWDPPRGLFGPATAESSAFRVPSPESRAPNSELGTRNAELRRRGGTRNPKLETTPHLFRPRERPDHRPG